MATSTLQATTLNRSSPFAVINSLRQGMLRAQVDEIAALVGLTDREMAYALNMTPPHLLRIKDEPRVSVNASERLLLLKNLLMHALDTFEGRKNTALHWLRPPSGN